VLTFERPAQATVVVRFEIATQGGLVDHILIAQLLYIQAGVPGDRFATTQDRPRILVELPRGEFYNTWAERLPMQLAVSLRRQYKLSRPKAREAARQVIAEWRKFGKMRMPKE
jgi:hypothetical protein